MWLCEVKFTVVGVLLVVAGEAALGQGYHQQQYAGPVRQNCPDSCERYYGGDRDPYYEQINELWSSCVNGCSYYSAHEGRMGNDPINVLNTCNYSCDERYYGEISQSCKAGCSFTYNAAVEANQERQQQQQFQRLQASPRSSRMEEIELPAETEAPVQQQPLPPFVQILNRIMPRINSIMQQTFARQLQEEDRSQQEPEHNIIQEEEEYGPIVRSFIIPMERPDGDVANFFGRKQSEDASPVFSQLFETANKMMQSIPEIPRISMNPWSNFPGLMRPENGDAESTGELIISRTGPGYSETKHYNLNNGQLIEIDEESSMGDDALAHVNPMDVDFNESDVEMINPFMEQHMVVPALEAEEHLVSEEPNYIMDPFINIPSEQYVQDPYVMEVDDGLRSDPFVHMSLPKQDYQQSPEFRQEEIPEEKEITEEKETKKEEFIEKAEVEALPMNHREFVFELDSNDIKNLRERLLNYLHWNRPGEQPQFMVTRSEYADVSCNSESLPLKDWLACAHLNVGVPRWLTAATIALGIIFSVWLCLVIPSAAPKQKIKSLVIKTQKLSRPSVVAGRELTAAEAKELEAEASREPVIAIIKVDLPPSYLPESPVPSYKSDMTPGSPAPSYKSIDTPLRTPEKKLEPVHGNNESVA
jgi:hypothetical protein